MIKSLKWLLIMAGLWFSCVSIAAELAMTVDINHADAEELAVALTGIGEKKAQRIVDYRNSHSPFLVADDLAKVKGIGTKTVNKNRNRILIGQVHKATDEAIKVTTEKTITSNKITEKIITSDKIPAPVKVVETSIAPVNVAETTVTPDKVTETSITPDEAVEATIAPDEAAEKTKTVITTETKIDKNKVKTITIE